MLRVSGLFVVVALGCLLIADVHITTLDPWSELQRMALGFATPDFSAVGDIGWVLVRTVAFAFCGVALGGVGGFVLSQFFHVGPVRWVCAFIRAIHELFWALIFLQMFGLTPLTGVLAIAIPYAGICAKSLCGNFGRSGFARVQSVGAGRRHGVCIFIRAPADCVGAYQELHQLPI